jgi:hypothetical protein
MKTWLCNCRPQANPPRGGDINDEDVIPPAIIEEINVTTDAGWDHSLNHYFIDDDLQVRQAIRIRVEDHLRSR